MFLKIFQVSTNKEMGKINKVNLSSFSTQNLFHIRACVISVRKAKHLDIKTMFTYSHANTPLSRSERAYYLSYFINSLYCKVQQRLKKYLLLKSSHKNSHRNHTNRLFYKKRLQID